MIKSLFARNFFIALGLLLIFITPVGFGIAIDRSIQVGQRYESIYGEFIPFSVVTHVVNLNYPLFNFVSSYGIQGFGVFLVLISPVRIFNRGV
jgi:hypothetical protein